MASMMFESRAPAWRARCLSRGLQHGAHDSRAEGSSMASMPWVVDATEHVENAGADRESTTHVESAALDRARHRACRECPLSDHQLMAWRSPSGTARELETFGRRW